MGKITWAAHIQKHHLPFILGLPSSDWTYRSPCALSGQGKLTELTGLLDALCSSCIFTQGILLSSLLLCPPLKDLWILLLGGPPWRLCICITTRLTHLVSHALAGVEPICRLQVVTPQTSFDRTCYCSICGGQASGCSSSLGELLPCDEGCTIKWQWFPSSLTCIASLGSVGSLCLPLCRKMLALVTEETLPFGVLNVCVHFCLWHTGNKAFIFHSEEQVAPLECWS